MQIRPLPIATWIRAAVGLAILALLGANVPSERQEDVYTDSIQPILKSYCYGCHGELQQKAGIRFDEVDPDMLAGEDAEIWDIARDLIGAGEMPPKKAEQMSDEHRRALMGWLNSSLEEAARAQEGEQHTILRRLNRAQYTNTLQELLALSIDFGKLLPADSKSSMGFTNNGETLLSSPLHLEYYQRIARTALDQAIVVGERPEPMHYRVNFGKGSGAGLAAGKTGGYQAIPLPIEDFTVDILDGQGRTKRGADQASVNELDAIKRRISVGFRGSSRDRFHSVEEGVVLYSALPHKEVAPGAWQGPSPNMKLELGRVFPQTGDFALRVKASRGYLVKEKKELLISLDTPKAQASLQMLASSAGPTSEQLLAAESTRLGAWHQAGPYVTKSGEEARDRSFIDRTQPLDFEAHGKLGAKVWRGLEDTDGKIQTYATKIGAVLLGRRIHAPSPRSMDLLLGSDDAMWVWLNGEEVLAADVRRGVAKDQNRLTIDLRQGPNDLLIKVVNYGGGFGSYHRVAHDGTSSGNTPYSVQTPDGARTLRAERCDSRSNVRFEQGGLVAVDFPGDSAARIIHDSRGGYFQFDLVHPAMDPDAMGSVRFAIGNLNLDLRPQATAEDLERGFMVTPVGAGYLNAGPHELQLGGPFFVGFSHLVITPLPEDHPLVVRLESQAVTEKILETPALRAFIGTRTDDGMDYMTFDSAREVPAPMGASQVYNFHGRLENLPIPEPESGDDEILSGILVVGVWNDHLVKTRADRGPPLLIEELEFEAPYYPQWPPKSHTRIFFDSPNSDAPETYTREVVGHFLERAFRRPIPELELERYMRFWHSIKDQYEHYEHGVREVLVAALSSPNFLFLAEPSLHDEVPEEQALAVRLAYFLWNSAPDAQLTALAQKGQLRANLEQEVTRLLDDERSNRFMRAFTHDWLRLDRLTEVSINPNSFPAFTRFVKRDMAEETYHFMQHVLREDLSLFSLVDSDFALLNQNLAEFYGIEGVKGIAFRAVSVSPEQGRGGLLSQGAFLAGHSDGNEPHPIKRAVWVKEKLLGKAPLPPPPNVPELDPEAPGFKELTLKQQLEKHRDNPACHDCHAAFDPFGIALERYSAVGLLEDRRKGQDIDVSTELPDGTAIVGASELKAYLMGPKADTFADSLIKHLYAYALGRNVAFADEPELQDIRERVRSKGDHMRAVIQAIASSPSFLEG